MKSTRYIYYININIFWSVYQYWVLNNNFILKILTFIRKTCHCVPFLNPVGIQYYPTVPSIFSPVKPGRWVSSSMKNVDLFSIIFPNKHARKSNEDLILKSHQPFGGHIFLGVDSQKVSCVFWTSVVFQKMLADALNNSFYLNLFSKSKILNDVSISI